MADLAPVCFCVSTKFKAWEPWLSLPQESFVNFAFWPRYYSLVGPELCEFALLNFSPKTVTNDRWQNVQRVLNETKTCHICRIDLFQACVKKSACNPFTKMLAHWWRISPIMLCDTMKALHHRRAGGLAWGTHKQEPLPSGRTFLQPFPSSTLRFPLPLLCLSLRFCLIMTYLKTRWVDYLEGWLLQMFLVIQMQILALKCPAHHNTYWISWSWPSML